MILNEIANDKKLLDACKGITKGNDLYHDLFQEVFLVCFEQGEERLKDIKKKKYLKFFLIRLALNLWQQRNGNFAKTYRHINDEHELLDNIQVKDEEYNYEIDLVYDKAIDVRDRLRPLYSISHKLHYEKGLSYRELEKQTGIPMKSIQVSAKKANEIIKEELCIFMKQ